MNLKRRTFLKLCGAAGAASLVGSSAKASWRRRRTIRRRCWSIRRNAWVAALARLPAVKRTISPSRRMSGQEAVFDAHRTTDSHYFYGGKSLFPAGARCAGVPQDPVHALRGAGLRFGVSGEGSGENRGGPCHL